MSEPQSETEPMTEEVLRRKAEAIVLHYGRTRPMEDAVQDMTELLSAFIMPALAASEAEVARLKAGDFTPQEFQNLCHNNTEMEAAGNTAEIEILAWNLAGCLTIAESRKPLDYNKSMARPALSAVNDLARDLAARDAEMERMREKLPRENPPPSHAFEVRINIGGEDWDYVVRTIRELSEHIPDHGPECNLCSGGAGGSHSVTIHKRDVTPEQYREELTAWRAALRPQASEENK